MYRPVQCSVSGKSLLQVSLLHLSRLHSSMHTVFEINALPQQQLSLEKGPTLVYDGVLLIRPRSKMKARERVYKSLTC